MHVTGIVAFHPRHEGEVKAKREAELERRRGFLKGLKDQMYAREAERAVQHHADDDMSGLWSLTR